jgi:hypothetical protein
MFQFRFLIIFNYLFLLHTNGLFQRVFSSSSRSQNYQVSRSRPRVGTLNSGYGYDKIFQIGSGFRSDVDPDRMWIQIGCGSGLDVDADRMGMRIGCESGSDVDPDRIWIRIGCGSVMDVDPDPHHCYCH